MEPNPYKSPFAPPPKSSRLAASARFWVSLAGLIARSILVLVIAQLTISTWGLIPTTHQHPWLCPCKDLKIYLVNVITLKARALNRMVGAAQSARGRRLVGNLVVFQKKQAGSRTRFLRLG